MTLSLFASPFIGILVTVTLVLISGGTPEHALAQERTWCIAKPSASDAELISNINYCCNQALLNCRDILEGGACYFPNTLVNHASVVMNLYYQTYNRSSWTCDFIRTGLTTLTNPSYGECNYA